LRSSRDPQPADRRQVGAAALIERAASLDPIGEPLDPLGGDPPRRFVGPRTVAEDGPRIECQDVGPGWWPLAGEDLAPRPVEGEADRLGRHGADPLAEPGVLLERARGKRVGEGQQPGLAPRIRRDATAGLGVGRRGDRQDGDCAEGGGVGVVEGSRLEVVVQVVVRDWLGPHLCGAALGAGRAVGAPRQVAPRAEQTQAARGAEGVEGADRWRGGDEGRVVQERPDEALLPGQGIGVTGVEPLDDAEVGVAEELPPVGGRRLPRPGLEVEGEQVGGRLDHPRQEGRHGGRRPGRPTRPVHDQPGAVAGQRSVLGERALLQPPPDGLDQEVQDQRMVARHLGPRWLDGGFVEEAGAVGHGARRVVVEPDEPERAVEADSSEPGLVEPLPDQAAVVLPERRSRAVTDQFRPLAPDLEQDRDGPAPPRDQGQPRVAQRRRDTRDQPADLLLAEVRGPRPEEVGQPLLQRDHVGGPDRDLGVGGRPEDCRPALDAQVLCPIGPQQWGLSPAARQVHHLLDEQGRVKQSRLSAEQDEIRTRLHPLGLALAEHRLAPGPSWYGAILEPRGAQADARLQEHRCDDARPGLPGRRIVADGLVNVGHQVDHRPRPRGVVVGRVEPRQGGEQDPRIGDRRLARRRSAAGVLGPEAGEGTRLGGAGAAGSTPGAQYDQRRDSDDPGSLHGAPPPGTVRFPAPAAHERPALRSSDEVRHGDPEIRQSHHPIHPPPGRVVLGPHRGRRVSP
jgi:hypothetical protein